MQHEQTAGRRYGEGMKGYVEDCACIRGDQETFCEFLRGLLARDVIKELMLYWTPSKYIKVASHDEIKTIIDIISSRRRIVVKTFKAGTGGDDAAVSGFKAEIQGFLKVRQILKGQRYHTISPGFVKVDKGVGREIYGVVVVRSDGCSYHTFTEGCSNPVDEMHFENQVQFDKFVREIGDALIAMHSKGYHHNDIKPDNMIYCPAADRFKLIDWELSGKFKDEPPVFYKCGTSLYNHPLKFYMGGLPAFVTKQLMTATVIRVDKHKWLKKTRSFGYIKKLAAVSLDWILDTDGDKSMRVLHHKYGPFLDNWAFAVTVIFLAEKHKMRVPEERLKKLMEPFLPKPVQES